MAIWVKGWSKLKYEMDCVEYDDGYCSYYDMDCSEHCGEDSDECCMYYPCPDEPEPMKDLFT